MNIFKDFSISIMADTGYLNIFKKIFLPQTWIFESLYLCILQPDVVNL